MFNDLEVEKRDDLRACRPLDFIIEVHVNLSHQISLSLPALREVHEGSAKSRF
jgi:hypothetical protein